MDHIIQTSTLFASIQDVQVFEMKPLLDSSRMKPSDWLNIANEVYRLAVEEKYAALVITHGTDTLAYTAAALTFLLPKLDRLVVLTGAQVKCLSCVTY